MIRISAKRPSDGVQGRARVEPEPAEPEDQHPEPEQRHVVPGDRPRLAVGSVLALSRAEQQQRRQRPGRADQVDRGRAGEVLHPGDPGAEPVTDLEEAPTEDPVGPDRVDDRREDDRVDDVDAELDPLQRRPPDDRQRDGAEDELEEPLRLDRRVGEVHHREARVKDLGAILDLRPGTEVREEEPAVVPDHAAQRAAEGEGKSDRPPAERRDREVGEDLGDDRPRVLAAREADLQKCEAGLHEHHQAAGEDHPHRVGPDRRIELAVDRLDQIGRVCEGRAGDEQQHCKSAERQ